MFQYKKCYSDPSWNQILSKSHLFVTSISAVWSFWNCHALCKISRWLDNGQHRMQLTWNFDFKGLIYILDGFLVVKQPLFWSNIGRSAAHIIQFNSFYTTWNLFFIKLGHFINLPLTIISSLSAKIFNIYDTVKFWSSSKKNSNKPAQNKIADQSTMFTFLLLAEKNLHVKVYDRRGEKHSLNLLKLP